jgi:hypothetical protein
MPPNTHLSNKSWIRRISILQKSRHTVCISCLCSLSRLREDRKTFVAFSVCDIITDIAAFCKEVKLSNLNWVWKKLWPLFQHSSKTFNDTVNGVSSKGIGLLRDWAWGWDQWHWSDRLTHKRGDECRFNGFRGSKNHVREQKWWWNQCRIARFFYNRRIGPACYRVICDKRKEYYYLGIFREVHKDGRIAVTIFDFLGAT